MIPWVFGSLGVPAAFTGFLVPIREAGVLLPQLAVAAAVRRLAVRKGVWLLGAVLSALSLFGLAVAAAMRWQLPSVNCSCWWTMPRFAASCLPDHYYWPWPWLHRSMYLSLNSNRRQAPWGWPR